MIDLKEKTPSTFIVRTNIKTIIKSYGITYKKLGEQLKMDQSNVYRYVNGERNISLKLLDKFAKIFNVESKDLLDPRLGLAVGWQLITNGKYKINENLIKKGLYEHLK
tara:strand:+ start:223 stop:546 length:324 start_codon:yes stop_codon:yes gene_type:complete